MEIMKRYLIKQLLSSNWKIIGVHWKAYIRQDK